MTEKKKTVAGNRQTLILNMVNKVAFTKCLEELNRNIKSTELQEMAESLHEWLEDKKVVYEHDGQQQSCISVSTYFLLKKKSKEDSARFLATFLADEHNCRLMLEGLPAVVKRAIKECLDHFFLPETDMAGWKGITHLLKKVKKWGSTLFELKCPWFVLITEYVEHDRVVNLSIHRSLYPYLYRAYYPQQADVTEQLSKEPQQVLETEESAIRVFPLVLEMFEKKDIDINSKGKMSTTALRQCSMRLGLFEEFFPATREVALRNLRASLLFPLLNYRFSRILLRSSREKLTLWKALHDDNPETLLPFPRMLLNLFLPHVSGLSSTLDISDGYFLVSDVVNAVKNWLACAPQTEEWIGIEEVIDGVLRQENGISHLLLFAWSDYSYNSKMMLKNGKVDGKVIPYGHYREEIFVPYVKAIFLMMASAGLFDIAYRDYNKSDRSWMDWLQQVRITPLGRYVLGLNETYQPNFKEKKVVYFDLDPDRLIVRSTMEKCPYALFLSEVSKPIGNSRYVFSVESFMKKCHAKSDVENKIEFFQNYISSDLSPVWTSFFEKLLTRCQPFASLKSTEYAIFQVPSNNKEMIHLLTTDSKLREMAIRAEGFIFLVKEEHKRKFSDRLRDLGYIL